MGFTLEVQTQQFITPTASRSFLNPRAIIEQAGVLPGYRTADFGSGHGYFVVELAQIVGAAGRVYAVDVQPAALEAALSRAATGGLSNVEPVLTNLELPGSTGLRDGSLDFVMISNLLHQVRDQEAVVEEAHRVLKEKGGLMIVGWIPHTALAPAGRHVSPDAVNDMAVTIGFNFDRSFDCGAYHWGLIFHKRPRGY